MATYQARLGLRTRPFVPSQTKTRIFWSQAHRVAYDRLCFAAKSRAPLTVFSGVSGSGRTTLVRELHRAQIPEVVVGLIPNPRSLTDDICAESLRALGMKTRVMREPEDNQRNLAEVLTELREADTVATLVVDYAERLTSDQLSTLCFFASMSTDLWPHLKLVLVGDDALMQRLYRDWPDLAGPSFTLEGMSLDDTVNYVLEALAAAGADRAIFSDDALEQVHECTDGIPRRINALCEACLEKAAQSTSADIDKDLVRRLAASQMMPETPLAGRQTDPESPPGHIPNQPKESALETDTTAVPETQRKSQDAPKLEENGDVTESAQQVRSWWLRARVQKRSVAALVLIAAGGLFYWSDPDTPMGERLASMQRSGSAALQILVSGHPEAAVTGTAGLVGERAFAAQARVSRIGGILELSDQSADGQYRAALDVASNAADAAVVSYTRAALRGHTRASYYLGQIFELGEGVPVDYARAAAWYSLAAAEIAGAAERQDDLPAAEVQGGLNAPVQLYSGIDPDGMLELVWISAEGMDPAHFRVEISLESGEVADTMADVAASGVRMETPENARAWRVVAMDGQSDDEAASPWLPLPAD